MEAPEEIFSVSPTLPVPTIYTAVQYSQR
jgi:hypothetical protein